MSDVYLDLSDDFQWDASGDLLTNSGSDLTGQRIGRRGFTNPQETDVAGKVTAPADYLFHPGYGGGIPRLVGSVVSDSVLARIATRMQAQMSIESTVGPLPAPVAKVVKVDPTTVALDCSYADATGPATIGFTYSP
jgi:hypothetical protein